MSPSDTVVYIVLSVVDTPAGRLRDVRRPHSNVPARWTMLRVAHLPQGDYVHGKRQVGPQKTHTDNFVTFEFRMLQ